MEQDAIIRLLRDGWRPRIKRSKGYEYVSLRRRRGETEVALGRKTEALWRFVQANRPKGEVAQLTSKVHALERRTTQLQTELDALNALKTQSRLTVEKAVHCRHIVTRSGERFCTAWTWPGRPRTLAALFPEVRFARNSVDRVQGWRLTPHPDVCAPCTRFMDLHPPNERDLAALTRRLANHEAITVRLKTRVDKMPTSTLYENFRCGNCGSRHLMAVQIECTRCGHTTSWGYRPQP